MIRFSRKQEKPRKSKRSLFATDKRALILKGRVDRIEGQQESPVIGFIRTCGAVCGIGALLILGAFFLSLKGSVP